MIHLWRFRITFMLLLLACALSAQNIDGYWEGMLKISPTDSLRLGMFVEMSGGTLQVELDSPDQYALGRKAENVSFGDDTLSWRMKSIGASYTGVYDGTRFVGTFIQNRKHFPLTLERGHERTVIRRPQTPQPPFPYLSEDLHFRSRDGGIPLINGILTMPDSRKPTALYILISGSGWQDRDESIAGHKPFLVIADHLTRTVNAAVFRYDDFPPALFQKSTTFDFADGVQLIMDSLQARPELAGLPVYLLGHSEGSIVAFIVASKDRRVSGIVTLGGVAQPMHEVLLYQLRAISQANHELSPAEIDNSFRISEELYSLVRKSKTPQEAARLIGTFWDTQCARLTPEEQTRYNMTLTGKITAIQQLTSPWFFTLFHFDPKKYIQKVRCPVIAINGGKDLQVDAVANQTLMRRYLSRKWPHQFHIIPNANHLLQTCTTGSPDEYGVIEETVCPNVLELTGNSVPSQKNN